MLSAWDKDAAAVIRQNDAKVFMDANRSELESERLVIVKRRCIKIAPALLLSCGLFCLPGCESGSESLRGAMEEKESAENIGAGGSEADEESSGEIMMPEDASSYVGSEWTVKALCDYFEGLGFTDLSAPFPVGQMMKTMGC